MVQTNGSGAVTETTFKLTEGLFRFEALGEKTVKGKKEPVKIYRVIAVSSRRTRFDVSAERGLTPFVSRERELELLLDGFERSKAGRGQAFSIMAEAGVGKSRLLYEFRKAVSNEDMTFLEGKCLSYSRGIAYLPVIDILKSTFNILENDDCVKIRDKVSQWLKSIGVTEVGFGLVIRNLNKRLQKLWTFIKVFGMKNRLIPMILFFLLMKKPVFRPATDWYPQPLRQLDAMVV